MHVATCIGTFCNRSYYVHVKAVAVYIVVGAVIAEQEMF